MTDPLIFEIFEEPAVKQRPRVTWGHGQVHAYTPPRTVMAERRLWESVQAQLGDDWLPLEGPISLSIIVYRRMPQRIPRRLWASTRPTARPDLDQHIKLVADALTAGVGRRGVWVDDAQLIHICAEKPGWVITVESLSADTGAAVANPEPICPPGGVDRMAVSREEHT